jgi:hypothetical protein
MRFSKWKVQLMRHIGIGMEAWIAVPIHVQYDTTIDKEDKNEETQVQIDSSVYCVCFGVFDCANADRTSCWRTHRSLAALSQSKLSS